MPGSSQGHYLRHAATILSHSPEHLAAAVSGPSTAGPYAAAGQYPGGLEAAAGYHHPMWGFGPGYTGLYPPGYAAYGPGSIGVKGFRVATSPPGTVGATAPSADTAAHTVATRRSAEYAADQALQSESLAPVAEEMAEAAAGVTGDTAAQCRFSDCTFTQQVPQTSSAADNGSRTSGAVNRYSNADEFTSTGALQHDRNGGRPSYVPPSLPEVHGQQRRTQQYTDLLLPGHVHTIDQRVSARLVAKQGQSLQRQQRRSLTRSCSF